MARLPAGTLQASTERLLSLSKAARLTGVRKRLLQERVRRGQIAVRLVGKGGDTKIRLTETALVEAGLLGSDGHESASSGDSNLAALVDLLREQNTRLATVEDQRLQLAGQLGAAMERVRCLEDRVLELSAGTGAHLERETAHGVGGIEGAARTGVGVATLGLAGAAVVRAVAAATARRSRRWPIALGVLVERVRHTVG